MNKVASIIFCFLSFTINSQVKKYTLLECVNIALEKNIRIQQSEFDLEGADIDRGDAIGNFLPRINAQSQHIWNNGLSQNITNGLIENLTTQFSSFGGNLGVTLFSGKQNINQLARANLNIISRQYQLEDMKDDISLFVANSYLQVMFNKEFEQYIIPNDLHIGYSAAMALENGEKVSAYLMDGRYYDCGTPSEYIELLKEEVL